MKLVLCGLFAWSAYGIGSDGRNKQVEYALRGASLGGLVIGVEAPEGAVIVACVDDKNSVMAGNTIDDAESKINKLSPNFALGIAGMGGDGRHLSSAGRVIAVEHWFKYGERPSGKRMARGLSQHALSFSRSSLTKSDERYRTARPMGVQAVLAGVDRDGGVVYYVSPGGDARRWRAVAIGNGAKRAQEELESELKGFSPPSTPKDRIQWTLADAVSVAVRVAARVLAEIGLTPSSDKLRIVVLEEEDESENDRQQEDEVYDSYTFDDGWSSLGKPIYRLLSKDQVDSELSSALESEERREGA